MSYARLSTRMQDALDAARNRCLRRYRRGWVAAKHGPFFERRTIHALINRGLARTWFFSGNEFLRITP